MDATKVNRLFKLIGGAFLIYAAYCALLFVMQRHVIFPRYMIPTPVAPDLKAMGIDPLWLETSFGKVEAWYLPPVSAGKPSAAVIWLTATGN